MHIELKRNNVLWAVTLVNNPEHSSPNEINGQPLGYFQERFQAIDFVTELLNSEVRMIEPARAVDSATLTTFLAKQPTVKQMADSLGIPEAAVRALKDVHEEGN